MPWLRILVRRGSYCRPYLFADKSIVLVGRDETCDVVVDDGAVSGCHALLGYEGGRWQLSDHDSSNGTCVGGIPLEPRWPRGVPPRCWVQIGNTELEVFGEPPARPEMGRSAELFAMGLTRDRDEMPLGLLRVEGGRELTKLAFRQRPYRIGRSRLCEIRGDSVLPSEEQVELRASSAGVTVTNIGEQEEVVDVGRVRLMPGESCGWHPRDMMRVGEQVFALWDSVQDALDELHTADLAANTAVPEDPSASRSRR